MIRKLLGKVRDVARGRRATEPTQTAAPSPADHVDAEAEPITPPDCEVSFVDAGKTIMVHRGKTLLHAIVRAGIPLPHECGGLASCGECLIASVTGEVSDRREIETRILKILGKPLDGRLACQTLVFGEVRVRIGE